jgi:hypothetical protein
MGSDSEASKNQGKLVRLSGAAVSVAFAVFLSFVLLKRLHADDAELSAAYLIGAWMVVVGAFAS